jgi:hypothetical protein
MSRYTPGEVQVRARKERGRSYVSWKGEAFLALKASFRTRARPWWRASCWPGTSRWWRGAGPPPDSTKAGESRRRD